MDSDITSLLMEGGALWLGTRDGYLLLLDLYSMLEGREPLLGLQYCGFGKVKCIAAIGSASSSKLQVSAMWTHSDFSVLWLCKEAMF